MAPRSAAMPGNHDIGKHPPNPHRLRKLLLCVGLLVLCCSATALAFAAKRIVVAQAASSTSTAPRCVPSTLNRSAVLPGTSSPSRRCPTPSMPRRKRRSACSGRPPASLADISVSGSRSGHHSGRLKAYSQGDGASFVSSKPFAAGETVTVRGRLKVAGKAQPFAYHFVVAVPDNLQLRSLGARPRRPGRDAALPLTPRTGTAGARDHGELDRRRRRETCSPPPTPARARTAPMIFNQAGQVIWFNPVPAGDAATNLQVQQLNGQPVLTYWQGYIPPQGFGEGEEVILNSDYQLVGRVHAGNGLKADLHDFHITPQDTAVLTVFEPIDCNLSSDHGPASGAVTDSIFQEIDLRTGLVRREWSSLDHVPLSDSYSAANTTSDEWPFDYFHLNSIDPLASGRTLISARNTWALYELSSTTGQVLLRIGGKHSEVKLAGNAATAFQHDATMLENGTISVFDNGGVPKVHPQSRGLVLAINPQTKTDTVRRRVRALGGAVLRQSGQHPAARRAATCSSAGAPSPTSPSSAPPGSSSSTATCTAPTSPTAPTASPGSERRPPRPRSPRPPSTTGTATVYASWNGATQVASWRVLAGASPTQLAPVATAADAGFETAIATPGAAPYVEVQALEAAGAVIGTSKTIKG